MSSHYHVVETFDIDHGELASVSPEQCFVLGVEWMAFRNWMLCGGKGCFMAHSINVSRLTALGERNGWVVTSMKQPNSSHYSTIRLLKRAK